MEHSRYRSNGTGGRNLEIVTARNLAENKIYVGGRSRPPFDPRMINYNGTSKKSSRTSSTLTLKKWWNDPESKRKRRVAKYKLYSAEGKIKSSFKKGYCWIRRTCIMMVRRL
ncbi:hypothetical protein ACB098_03G024400 [Castanea mollissima]